MKKSKNILTDKEMERVSLLCVIAKARVTYNQN